MKDLTLPTPALPPLATEIFHAVDNAMYAAGISAVDRQFVFDSVNASASVRAALSHHEDGGRAAIPEYGTKWISVTEMVPATPHRDDSPIPGLPRATATLTSDPVLVWCGYPAVTTFVRGEGSGDGDFFARSSVTHWRPIQSPGNVVALGGEKGEPPCNPHPDAPHGYNRNASHNAGRYVCDCEGWAALGGEKGEAVAETENALRPDHPLAKGSCVHGESMAKHCAWCSARPVGKARMLTDEEADHITGMHNTGRAQGDSECAEAIQRKFCEVNGITLEGGNRSGG